MELNDKVVLVTGASGGIGLEAARQLAQKGARVALAARSADALKRLATDLPGSLAVPTDMMDEAAVRRMVDTVQAHYGRLDVLVNNAGRGLHVPLEQVSLQAYRDLFELNVVSVLNAMQAAAVHMRQQGGGLIVNVSSGTTMRVLPGVGAYSSTKHALNNLSQVARLELAGDGIRVGVVYPFITETAFAANAGAAPHPEADRPDSAPRPAGVQPDTAEYAASLIVQAIETEEPEVYAEQVRRMKDRG